LHCARREFIGLVGGAIIASPLAARAQQQGMKRVAIVIPGSQGDREYQVRLTAFFESLARLGWSDGRNVRFDVRWAGTDTTRYKAVAMEVTTGSVIERTASSFSLKIIPMGVHDGAEIERSLLALVEQPDSGLIALPHPILTQNRDLIIVLAARHRLPAIYPFRYFATSGGLISYGIDPLEQWRGVADYVDRILKGEKPGDLPVQALNKYELVINLRTAKAIGVNVPGPMLARADVIE
jgi:ABC transporter substrate binding protein